MLDRVDDRDEAGVGRLVPREVDGQQLWQRALLHRLGDREEFLEEESTKARKKNAEIDRAHSICFYGSATSYTCFMNKKKIETERYGENNFEKGGREATYGSFINFSKW